MRTQRKTLLPKKRRVITATAEASRTEDTEKNCKTAARRDHLSSTESIGHMKARRTKAHRITEGTEGKRMRPSLVQDMVKMRLRMQMVTRAKMGMTRALRDKIGTKLWRGNVSGKGRQASDHFLI